MLGSMMGGMGGMGVSLAPLSNEPRLQLWPELTRTQSQDAYQDGFQDGADFDDGGGDMGGE